MAAEPQKLEFGGTAGDRDTPVQVQILPLPVKRQPIGDSEVSKDDVTSAKLKESTIGMVHQSTYSSVQFPSRHTRFPSVMVVSKVAGPAGVAANVRKRVTTPVMSQASSINPATTQGRTVVITVPRAASPQPVHVAPRPPQTASTKLPANIQIPPGMMLIRSDSGQLMLVSQQALAQTPQGPGAKSAQAPRILPPQVSPASASKGDEKVTAIRMAPTSAFQPSPRSKTALVITVASKPAVQALSSVADRGNQSCFQPPATEIKKEPSPTFSQEILESVKKCKNFLVTLIKLTSGDSKSANMANNVRGLVRKLLEGKLEAQEFTEELYQELKSTPQPCLVPFLKKSLPAVRQLTADPELFIQQASASTRTQTVKTSSTETGKNSPASKQARGVTRPGLTMLAPSKSSKPTFISKHRLLHSGEHLMGMYAVKQPCALVPPYSIKSTFRNISGSYKEDDDINDVASMAGVNLREENAQILTSMVGSVVQSCQDQPFLCPNPVLSQILHTGQALGVTDVGPEVVALVSHATQEWIRGLLEKLTAMAGKRKEALREDLLYTKVSDVRCQLRFVEEVERLKKRRKEEEEREQILHLARSRSHPEDPQHQQLKQRAKEWQEMEEAQLQQREANFTALAAIGPRKKRPQLHMKSQRFFQVDHDKCPESCSEAMMVPELAPSILSECSLPGRKGSNMKMCGKISCLFIRIILRSNSPKGKQQRKGACDHWLHQVKQRGYLKIQTTYRKDTKRKSLIQPFPDQNLQKH